MIVLQRTDIKEIPDEEELCLRSLPLPSEGPIIMKLDKEDTKEEVDVRNLRSYLGKEDEENEKKEQEWIWVRTKRSISHKLAQKLAKEGPKVKLPKAFKDYQSVFEKKSSERLPTQKP